MEGNFLVIGITQPAPEVRDEVDRIVAMLDSNALDRMHLRKPYSGIYCLGRLLKLIPARLHCRLSLHDAPELICDFPEVGFHFNSRFPFGVKSKTTSFSCHSLEEVINADEGLDYVTLSPVFDSISKPGYEGRIFDCEYGLLAARRVVAMGGVVPDRFRELKARGFGGAGMLGYLWDYGRNINDIIEEIKVQRRICCSL